MSDANADGTRATTCCGGVPPTWNSVQCLESRLERLERRHGRTRLWLVILGVTLLALFVYGLGVAAGKAEARGSRGPHDGDHGPAHAPQQGQPRMQGPPAMMGLAPMPGPFPGAPQGGAPMPIPPGRGMGPRGGAPGMPQQADAPRMQRERVERWIELNRRGDSKNDRREMRPRDERSRGDDRMARGERDDRPGRGDRPERGDRPDRGDRPERPDRDDRPERGDRPAR